MHEDFSWRREEKDRSTTGGKERMEEERREKREEKEKKMEKGENMRLGQDMIGQDERKG